MSPIRGSLGRRTALIRRQTGSGFLPATKAALADSATTEMWINFMGDSTTLGVAGGAAMWTESVPARVRAGLSNSYPLYGSSRLAVSGPGFIQMHTTAAGPSETWGAAEQLTLTGTWTAAPSTVAVWSENVNDTVTVTMVYAARYLKMGYLRLAGAYEFSYRVNGGAWVASGSLAGGSIAYQFLEVDCGSDGLHTVDFRVDSGYLCIEGFMTRREAAGGLQVHNSGLNGARPSTSYLDGLYQQSVTPVWTVADPVLTVIQFGTNNWNNQDDVAGSEADLLSLVNTTKVRHPNTEILLMSMYPVNQADKAIGQAEYVAAQAEVAASSADYYLDTWTRWMALDGSTFSSYYFDGLHPNPLGNAENAGVILDLLLGL